MAIRSSSRLCPAASDSARLRSAMSDRSSASTSRARVTSAMAPTTRIGDAGPIGDDVAADRHPGVGAVAAAEAILLLPAALAPAERALDPGDDPLAVFGVDVLVPPGGGGGQSRRVMAEQRLQAARPTPPDW